jgi:hypothetical protein
MMKSFLLPFAAIAIAVAMPTQAQTTQRYDIASFDVAGVSLGMSPETAREAMRKAGFNLTEKAFAVTQTYEGLVRRKAQQLQQPMPQISSVDGPAEIDGRDSKGNKLSVLFISTTEGPKVSTVRLTFDKDSNNISSLRDDIVSRYGAPTQEMFAANGLHWCDESPNACGLSSERYAPKLEYSPALQPTLILTGWPTMKRDRDADIARLFQAPDGERQRSLLGGS